MATEKVTSEDKKRFFMFAGLVVTATIGLMFLVSGGDDKSADPKTSNAAKDSEEEVLEVQPLIPKGRIVSASWRDGSAPRADNEVVESNDLDGARLDPFGEDKEKSTKAQKNLRKTIDRIHGLGVYVAPADDNKKDK